MSEQIIFVPTLFSLLIVCRYINMYLFILFSLFLKYFLSFLLLKQGISSSLASLKSTAGVWFELFTAWCRPFVSIISSSSPSSLELSSSSVIPSLVCRCLVWGNGVNWEEKLPEHNARSCELSPSQWLFSINTLASDFDFVASLKPSSSRTPWVVGRSLESLRCSGKLWLRSTTGFLGNNFSLSLFLGEKCPEHSWINCEGMAESSCSRTGVVCLLFCLTLRNLSKIIGTRKCTFYPQAMIWPNTW